LEYGFFNPNNPYLVSKLKKMISMKNLFSKDFIYGLAIGVLVLVAFGFRGAVDAPAEQKWEYLVAKETPMKKDATTFVLFQGADKGVMQEFATESNMVGTAKLEQFLGAQGWELVSVEVPYVISPSNATVTRASERILHFKRAL
jgi:hypothetical protein